MTPSAPPPANPVASAVHAIVRPAAIASMAEHYNVTFSEVGLPAGTDWAVQMAINFSFVIGAGATAPGPAVLSVPNGSFEFNPNVPGYNATPAGGVVSVSGADMAVSLQFAPGPQVLWPVAFFETGLPTGTVWGANVSGSWTNSTVDGPRGGVVVALLPNGTYGYRMSAVASYVLVSGHGAGTIYLAGTATLIEGEFAPVLSIVFSEDGLPTGTTWWVVQASGPNESTTASVIVFPVLNGTFSYTAGAASGYSASPSAGDVSVAGRNQSVTIHFDSAMAYSVTLTESGLPSGTEWWANVTGQVSRSSGTAELALTEPNGTYPYTVGTTDKRAAASAGSFRVAGELTAVQLVFQAVTYEIDFDESGLAGGSAWSVTVNGTALSSDSTSVSFAESNGTYPFVVAEVPGYPAAIPDLGEVTVAGHPLVEQVLFNASSGIGDHGGQRQTPLGPNEGLELVGVALAATAIALAIVTARRRRQRRNGPALT